MSNNNIQLLKEKLDLLQVISETVKLKKRAHSHIGLCPFHNEKTPSFNVFERKGYFRCFGCNASGDVLDFIGKLRNQSLSDVIADLSGRYGIELPQNSNKKQDPLYAQQQALYQVNAWAQSVFAAQPDSVYALLLAEGRPVELETIRHFGIGYCNGNTLSDSYRANSQNETVILESGLVKSSDNGRQFDSFRNRAMFPIKTAKGKIAGFSGRALGVKSSKAPKYLNSPDSVVYHKSELFFGLSENLTAICGKKEAIMVEGPFDVIALWESGMRHVVAACGTACTDAHAQQIAKYSDKVTLCFDNDKAGYEATLKTWQMLESYGLFVRVCALPDKQDPDSLFREIGKEAFSGYFADNTQDAICWFAEKAMQIPDLSDKQKQLEFVKEYLLTSPFHHVVPDWKSILVERFPQLRLTLLDKPSKVASSDSLQIEEFSDTKLNLFAQDGCYLVKAKGGKLREISNFIMIPKYYLPDNSGSYRVFELINTNGERVEISMDGTTWTRHDKFCRTLEDQGNFVFTGEISDIRKLKRYYFGNLENAVQLGTLGYSTKHGLYAWSNGIHKSGIFYQLEERTSLVKVGSQLFALPKLTTDQKRFSYSKSDVSFSEMMLKMSEVFAEDNNGLIGVLYLFASIYRDVIFKHLAVFPLLFCQGVPSSGKSTFARTLISWFGQPQKQVNLTMTTPVAMFRRTAFLSNSIVWLDEYKNALKGSTIEFLKGLYDGAGRVQGAYTSTLETSEVEVTNGVVVSGQDLPTHDPALLSRVVLLEFRNRDFSDKDRATFKQLISMLEKGTGHLIADLADQTEFIAYEFASTLKRSTALLESEAMKQSKVQIESRIICNYAILLTVGLLVRNKFRLDSALEDHMSNAVSKAMLRHLEHQSDNNDLAQFWEIFERLTDLGKLVPMQHFRVVQSGSVTVEDQSHLKTEVHADIQPVLLIQFGATADEYRMYYYKLHIRTGLSHSTLSTYLKGSDAFLGTVQSFRFGSKNTSAFAFALDKLPITLSDETLAG